MRCSGCGVEKDAGLLDAVLLDLDGKEATTTVYCEACFPRYVKVRGDKWRSLYDEEVSG